MFTSSARSSRRRQHPFRLEKSKESEALIIDKKLEDKHIESRLSAQERKRKFEPVVLLESADPSFDQHLLGKSSENPLKLLQHQSIRHGKVRMQNFVGDGQPTTGIQMAHLFGAHPAALPSNTPGIDPTRIISERPDESLEVAGVDVEMPSEELLEYIRTMADSKLSTSRKIRRANKQKERRDSGEQTERSAVSIEVATGASGGADTSAAASIGTAAGDSLEGKFDNTALVAVGVLVEELVRDMMIQWYRSGTPLQYNSRALRTEALTQASGAPDVNNISTEILQNRLEVIQET